MAKTQLSPDEVEYLDGLARQPSEIKSAQVGERVLAMLEDQIANLDSQLAAFQLEVAANPKQVADERATWLKRASYARSFRWQRRDGVLKRLRELRGVYVIVPSGATAEAKLAKENRLLAEAEARKTKRLVALAHQETQRQRLALLRSTEHAFMVQARNTLPSDVFAEILNLAQRSMTV